MRWGKKKGGGGGGGGGGEGKQIESYIGLILYCMAGTDIAIISKIDQKNSSIAFLCAAIPLTLLWTLYPVIDGTLMLQQPINREGASNSD